MAKAQYYIAPRNARWWIKFDGTEYGPYSTQGDASRAATDAANQSGKNGRDAQVLVQGRGTRWQVEWTYGQDHYPPRRAKAG